MFIWPLDDHIITRDFYYLASLYVGGQHAAIDLIRRTGTTRAAPIRAISDGIVAGVGWDMYSGFFVAVDHADGWRSFYRHLYGQTPVAVSQQVSQGQIIGNVGNTGWSQGDHLHFDLWNRNKIRDDAAIFFKNGWYAVDPALYLGQEEDMDEATIRSIFREMMAEHSSSKERFKQIADNLPSLNQHIAGLVTATIRGMISANNCSRERFKQIANNLPDLNQHLRNIVGAIAEATAGDAGGGVSEAEARAIAQEEDIKLRHTKG